MFDFKRARGVSLPSLFLLAIFEPSQVSSFFFVLTAVGICMYSCFVLIGYTSC
jgi:hypothetical protein